MTGVSAENRGSAKVTTVLLDLDGVLMDHRGAAASAVQHWLGARATPDVVAAWFRAQDARLAEWRDGSATWEEQRRNRLRDVLPLIGDPVGTDDELDALFAAGYLPAYEQAWRAFDDAADALGLRKPDPRAFLTVCERLEAAPGTVVYVGDEFEVDVLGARSAGLQAVLLDRDGTAPPPETAVIQSLSDLVPLLER